MSLSLQDMQRELHQYAMAEMRNRGLEEAARLVSERAGRARLGAERFDLEQAAMAIRALKTDPSDHLSDWWGQTAQEQVTAQQTPGA